MENDIREINETLKRATALLAVVSEDTTEMKGDIKAGREIQEMHTTALDEIRKNTKTWQSEIAAVKSAINGHEKMFEKLAKHLGLDLEKI